MVIRNRDLSVNLRYHWSIDVSRFQSVDGYCIPPPIEINGVELHRSRAFLMLENAAMVVSVHAGLSEGRLVCLRREWSGWIMAAQFGMKHL